jgi:hypothetical protein
MLSAMNPLASFSVLMATAQSLVAAVRTRDDLHLRPALVRKAVAVRLVSGLRVLRAFLRRMIILIALKMEWGLKDTRGPMKRPHGRKAVSTAPSFSLPGLDRDRPSPWLNSDGPKFKPKALHSTNTPLAPVYVDMAKLYGQLDFLARIAADPSAKAKRLAFHLARTYHGIMMAPEGPKRIAGRWGTEVRALYDAMAHNIIEQSRNRPPPLPPPRTHWPTITAF